MTNILIVEDNKTSRENFVKVLNEELENVNIYEAGTGEEAVLCLKEKKIDLFFLDIQLPDFSGLKVAEIIRSIPHYELTYIIFITSHITFLPKALQEYHCYDYIEKPFKKQKILDIANKLIKGINKTKNIDENLSISIHTKNIIHRLYLEDIYFLEVNGRKVLIHSKAGILELSNYTMKKMVALIEEKNSIQFLRAHRSFYINAQHIKSIHKSRKKSWDIKFTGYEEVALLGDKYRDAVLKRLGGTIL